jgi:hypothetical protein
MIERAGFYRPEAMHGAEDFDLWVRLSRVTRLENLPDVLCAYRSWQDNISTTRAQLQEQVVVKIVKEAISRLLDQEITIEMATYLRGLAGVANAVLPESLKDIRETAEVLRRIYRAYFAQAALQPGDLRAISWSTAYRLYMLSKLAARHSLQAALALRAQALGVNPYLALTIDARKLVRRALAR